MLWQFCETMPCMDHLSSLRCVLELWIQPWNEVNCRAQTASASEIWIACSRATILQQQPSVSQNLPGKQIYETGKFLGATNTSRRPSLPCARVASTCRSLDTGDLKSGV